MVLSKQARMSKHQEIIIISGRSGAGKSVAAKALEDMGFFVVDNLPPQLLDNLLSLAQNSKVAVIVDVREHEFLELLPNIYKNIDKSIYNKNLFYLDASEQKLIDRYQETKRRHPLDNGCGIRAALESEHKLLEPIRELATKKIHTDKLNSHELKQVILRELNTNKEYKLPVRLLSFGFKYGVPSELDLCFDVRFLKNPYYEAELRFKSGLDQEVYDYVISLPHAGEFIDKIVNLIEYLYPLYILEGKSSLTIAVGCTGGRHRSTSLIEALKGRLESKIDHIRVEHRDLARHT
jgi:UPF0042 nucleotide-binding protein